MKLCPDQSCYPGTFLQVTDDMTGCFALSQWWRMCEIDFDTVRSFYFKLQQHKVNVKCKGLQEFAPTNGLNQGQLVLCKFIKVTVVYLSIISIIKSSKLWSIYRQELKSK